MNWDLTKVKFVNEIYTGLCTFFGANAEETTEAELHQMLTEAGTIEQIQEKAAEKVSARLTELETKLNDVSAKIADLESEIQGKVEQINELTTKLTEASAQLTEREKAITEKESMIQKLSGEVASLKAGANVDKTSPPDASLPLSATATTSQPVSYMTVEQLNEMLKRRN